MAARAVPKASRKPQDLVQRGMECGRCAWDEAESGVGGLKLLTPKGSRHIVALL